MKIFEVYHKDFHPEIIFADSIADARAKYPEAVFIIEVVIH